MSAVPKQLTPWSKGQSGNPGGRPKIPDALRAIRSLSYHEMQKLVSKYARMTQAETAIALADRETPMIERTIASIFWHSDKYGDCVRLAFLLDRAIGKVPVAIEDDDDRAARKEIEDLSDHELIKLVAEKLPELKEKVG